MAKARELWGHNPVQYAVEGDHPAVADLFEEAAKLLRYSNINTVHAVNVEWSEDIGTQLILTVEA